ncbi:hypothetical protein D3C85_885850 [compost metagenome]
MPEVRQSMPTVHSYHRSALVALAHEDWQPNPGERNLHKVYPRQPLATTLLADDALPVYQDRRANHPYAGQSTLEIADQAPQPTTALTDRAPEASVPLRAIGLRLGCAIIQRSRGRFRRADRSPRQITDIPSDGRHWPRPAAGAHHLAHQCCWPT